MYGKYGIFPMIIGFIMWIPLIAIYASLGFYFDNIEISLEKSYEQEFNNCQAEEKVLMKDFMELKQQKKIVCEYKEPRVNFWMPFFAFLIGVIATLYSVFIGYPLIKNRLDKKKEVNKHDKKKSVNKEC